MKNLSLILLSILLSASYIQADGQIITTFAGTGVAGFSGDGGPATAAQINTPECVTFDAFGNIYFADWANGRIRKIDKSGIITTIAGNGTVGDLGDGGPATAAQLRDAWNIVADAVGNIYLTSRYGHRVRKISTSGIITSFAGTGVAGYSGDGGPATAAKFDDPWGLYADLAGNLYVGDYVKHRVRKINSSGIISAFAGNGSSGVSGDGGPATAATINNTYSMALDHASNLYLSDHVGNRVRVINSAGVINTFAGNAPATTGIGDGGPATSANLFLPYGIAADLYGNLYISDYNHNRVRMVNSAGMIKTIAGTGTAGYGGDWGPATAAKVNHPCGITVDGSQSVFFSDERNHRIRFIRGHNRVPYFLGGNSQSITVCENYRHNSLDTFLSVVDSDFYQMELWSLISGPVHGTVAGMDTILSTGDTVWPTGLEYAPAIGYTGNDSFMVRVTDCQDADTIKIYVTVIPSPATITGVNNVCIGSVTALTSTTTGAVWTSSNTAVASIGSGNGIVTSFSIGTTVISYTLSNGCAVVDTVSVNPLPSPIIGVTSVCIGATSNLTDVGGGTWTSSNTIIAVVGSMNGIVSAIIAGSSTISYILPTGCLTTTTVYTFPLPFAITGVTTICPGGATTLSNAAPFGTWSSSNSAVAIVGSGSGVVSGVLVGTAVISYQTFTSCPATVTVTVNPLPPLITGSSIVCVGASTLLSNAATGGMWTSGISTVATIGSVTGLVSGSVAGTTTISYTLSTGCLTTTPVTVNPVPASITGMPTVCIGATTVLSNSLTGGSWSTSAPSVAGIGSGTGIVSGLSVGTSTITYKMGTGCNVTTVVTVNPLPGAITGVAKVCPGMSTVLSTPSTGGVWSTSNSAIAVVGSATGVVNGLTNGNAKISYTLGTGCYAATTVTVNTLPNAILYPTTLCMGATSTSASYGGTGPGVWSSSSTTVASVSSLGLWTGLSVGTAVITYMTALTGCFTTTTVTVTPSPGVITGVSTICSGATTTLSNAVPGGVWSSGSTAIAGVGSGSGIVTGLIAGTATITYSLGAGCIATRVVTVSSLAAITGAGSICTGQTITLSNPVSGGKWSSSATAIAIVGTGSGIVTGISPGTTTITYLLPSGCSASAVVAVNAVPPGITGIAQVCIGQTTTLSNSAGGGTWSSLSPKVIVGTTVGNVTGLTAGTATITYSLGSGCTVAATVTVNALPLPITGASDVCVGAAIPLSDLSLGGTWSTGSGGAATVGISGVVTGIATGTEVITYTLGTGCAAIKTVTVNDLPSAITGTMNLCAGSTVSLTSTTAGGTWSTTGGIATIGLSTGVVTGSSTGTATITYKLATGCMVTDIVSVNPLPSSITGPATVCEGATIALSNTTPGGTWSTSGSAIATVAGSGIVTGVSAGVANITYETGAGCAATKAIVVSPVALVTGTPIVCVGATTTLSANVMGGIWSSGSHGVATASTGGIVRGISTGTTMITYRTPLGCNTATMVTVNALPSAGVIAGASDVCVGSTITLSSTAAGGIWSSAATTVITDVYTGDVTGISMGTAKIIYSVTNSCGTDMATHTVTINPLPVAGSITGASDVCVGVTITLTNIVATGFWSSGDASVAVGSVSGAVTGVSAGSATITYTVASICGTAMTIRAVTVNPLPVAGAITGASNVCVGAVATLTNTVAGGLWLSSNSRATISGGIVTGVSAGLDTIIYVTSNMCGTASVIHYIAVNPLPYAGAIFGPATVCDGMSITLTDPVGGGKWSSTDGNVSVGSSTGMVTGLSAGDAMITYTVTNICGTDIAIHSLIVNLQPVAGIITGATSVCEGKDITLTSSAGGGIWSSGNDNATIADGLVTGVSSGSVIITYSVTNMCGTAIATYPVTINPQPQAGSINGPSQVCIGTEIALADLFVGGVWSSADIGVTIGSATGIVTGVATGTATITYTVTNVCGAATAVKVIGIISLPTVDEITGLSAVCEGAAITLTDLTDGGVWASRSGNLSVTDGVVTGTSAGYDTVVYSVSNICGNATTIKEVLVNPLPPAGTMNADVTLCKGESISMLNICVGGVWGHTNNATGSLSVSPDNTVHLAALASGHDTITYAIPGICGSTVNLFPYTIRTDSDCAQHVNVGDPFDCSGNGELVIYPNPNPGKFTINVSSDIQEQVSIVIVNMLGQRLRMMATLTNQPLELALDEPAGVYIVTVVSAHGRCSKKVTVVK